MVQHAVSPEIADRGITPRSRKRIKAQRPVETGVGRGGRSRSRWARPCVVREDGGSAAATGAAVAGFFNVVARIFQRRFPTRSRGYRKILERPESSGSAVETRGFA